MTPQDSVGESDEPRVLVKFTPQVWVCDAALEANAEGPKTWTMPLNKALLGGSELPDDCSNESDELRDLKFAPKWVRTWSGPFSVEILNRDEIEAYLEARLTEEDQTPAPAPGA